MDPLIRVFILIGIFLAIKSISCLFWIISERPLSRSQEQWRFRRLSFYCWRLWAATLLLSLVRFQYIFVMFFAIQYLPLFNMQYDLILKLKLFFNRLRKTEFDFSIRLLFLCVYFVRIYEYLFDILWTDFDGFFLVGKRCLWSGLI